eukprot:scaffold98084_cov36-Attheya_sp.AAC.4
MGKIDFSKAIVARGMLLLVFALFWVGNSPVTAQNVNLNNFELEDLLDKNVLRQPVDIAWTPDGRVLVATKNGIIKVYDENFQEIATSLDVSNVLCTDQERGLQSILIHPNFEHNKFIYVYYMHKGDDGNCNTPTNLVPAKDGPSSRLSRFILPNSNEINVSTEKVIIETGPSGKSHNGGGMAFGTDGNIYLSTGDTGYKPSMTPAPKLNNLFGKILRITDDGEIPEDNPYYKANNKCNEKNTPANGGNKECPEIFSVGLRNPFNLAMDPNNESVRFYIGDIGWATWEEINEGGLGFEKANYGWAEREGPCQAKSTARNQCGVGPSIYTNPLHWYRNPDDGGAAITGTAFVPHGIWPDDLDGAFLHSDLRANTLYHMKHTPSRA